MHSPNRCIHRFGRCELRDAVPEIEDMSGARPHISKILEGREHLRFNLLGMAEQHMRIEIAL